MAQGALEAMMAQGAQQAMMAQGRRRPWRCRELRRPWRVLGAQEAMGLWCRELREAMAV